MDVNNLFKFMLRATAGRLLFLLLLLPHLLHHLTLTLTGRLGFGFIDTVFNVVGSVYIIIGNHKIEFERLHH